MSYAVPRQFSLMLIVSFLGVSPGAFAEGVPEVAAPPSDANALSPDDVGVTEKLGQQAALDLNLRDEEGKPINLRSIIDRPTILTLNYFRCGGICSPQLNGLAKAISHTNAVPGAEFRVITVSFDERDTPDIAAHKQQNYLRTVKRPISPADWHFLTGDGATTRQLADSVGFRFKQVGSDFVHPGALMFLSPTGKITRYMYGTSYLPADLEMAVREAARGEAQPTINKWLEFCFSFDPKGRKYAFNVTRIAGALGLAAALVFVLGLVVKRGAHKPPATKRAA
jgi:protein SCO1